MRRTKIVSRRTIEGTPVDEPMGRVAYDLINDTSIKQQSVDKPFQGLSYENEIRLYPPQQAAGDSYRQEVLRISPRIKQADGKQR